MNNIYKTFLQGLVALLPLTLSIYFLIWFFLLIESMVDNLFFNFLPFEKPFWGLGIILGSVVIWGVGSLLKSMFFSKIFGWLQGPLKNIPLVKSVYSAVEDLMFFFSKDSSNSSKVVVVKVSDVVQLVGLMTKEDCHNLVHEQIDEHVAVFVPMSYALGGYTIFVPKDRITVTDLPVEKAMKSALTAWMSRKTT